MDKSKVQVITKTQIISLIRDDLINYKLVSSLNDIGLDAYDYFLHLSETIFDFMGFDESESDEVFEGYLRHMKKVKRLNIKNSHAAIDSLANIIYKELLSKRPKQY